MTQGDLAAAMEKLGRPIPVASIGKIEAGDRRVEVDDLVALAIALGTTPNALLLPATRSPEDVVEVTGSKPRDSGEIWLWASGSRPLDSRWAMKQEDFDDVVDAFRRVALPWWVFDLRIVTYEVDEQGDGNG